MGNCFYKKKYSVENHTNSNIKQFEGVYLNDIKEGYCIEYNITGEKIWIMPLDEGYKKQNRSKIADIKNTGGRAAGSITAAHFIGEFVGDTPWVHLDIAGTANSASRKGWIPQGATGFPCRTLIETVLKLQY